MQPMYETILARDISTPPLQAVPPTAPSCASTRSKSKIAPQINLGLVAPFVANLRGQALARQSTPSVGQARRPREDGPRRGVTKQTKQIKSATGPTQDKTKTKKLVEFGCGGSDSDNSDPELASENDDTSHAEAPSDSIYCEGD
jgi:hypothetical protein